jgi:adenine-specific DNA-methyltransferase
MKSIKDIINKSQEFNQRNKDLIKNEGVVFTKQEICNQIIDIINPKITETICEPSVGRGSFVFALLEKFRKEKESIESIVYFIQNNLFCFDINIEFIDDFKSMLNSYVNLLGYNNSLNLDNIKCEDFLLQKIKCDIVIGNPPYVRIQNIDKNYLESLKEELKSVTLGNIDLYYAFLEKALISSGRVGFIIPNSFIKTKSGKFLREIIKKNVRYIYDFVSDKVWDNISTYTCIVICDNKAVDTINYVTKHENIIKSKSELSENIWVFLEQNNGTKNLSDIINYCGGGLATIKDSIFKMDSSDDIFCYKGKYKLEIEICKKVIKATKEKNYNEHKWILYPYDTNSKILDESYIKENYPFAYSYLLDVKSELNTRDKGKTSKYDSWYAYGRRQGLLKSSTNRRLILPSTFLKSRGIHYVEIPIDDSCLVLSGILVDIKEEHFKLFIKIISSDDFYNYCELNNKTLKDKVGSNDIWLSITSTTLKNYKY